MFFVDRTSASGGAGTYNLNAAAATSGVRILQDLTATFDQAPSWHQRPETRWRAASYAERTRWGRSIHNRTDVHIPWPVKEGPPTQEATPDVLTIVLAAPSVSVNPGEVTAYPDAAIITLSVLTPTTLGYANPSPFAITLSAPSVTTLGYANPSPLTVTLSALVVSAQAGGAQTAFPSVATVTLSMPDVVTVATATPEPLVMALSAPDVTLVSTLGPLKLRLNLLPVITFGGPQVTDFDGPFGIFFLQGRTSVATYEPGASFVVRQRIYEIIITGAQDGLAYVELPVKSAQAIARRLGNDTVQLTIPNAAQYLGDVLARPNGDIVIREKVINFDGTYQLNELIRGSRVGETIQRTRGSSKDSLQVFGKTAVNDRQTRGSWVLEQAFQLTTGGRLSISAPLDARIKPGDKVTFGTLVFFVDEISYSLAPGKQTMTLTEKKV